MYPISVDSWTSRRLIAERITLDHFDEIRQLHRDPAVMKTLSADGRILPDETTRTGLKQAVEHWQRHGFGFWILRDRGDHSFIGRGGLKIYRIDDRDEVGLAYAVVFPRWGQGYGTEMAQASLEIGFSRLGLPEVSSWTLPVNHASQRVMEKLGFLYEREFEFAGLTHCYYRLTAARWNERAVMRVTADSPGGSRSTPGPGIA